MIATAALCTSLISLTVHAQFAPPVEVDDVNVVGLGVGAEPDYMGSANSKVVAAPVARYQLPGSQRYVQLLGPQLQMNIIDDERWRFGPMINYRFGRDNDVEDNVVKHMSTIDGNVEGGAFVQYNYKLSAARMHKLAFGADLAGGSNGTVGNLRMTWWQPLGPATYLNLGLGTTIVSDKWMKTYFGVTKPGDIALYPSLAGQAFDASGGVKSYNIPFGITQAVSREWLVSVGGRYEALRNDAKSSPITSERGKSDQWLYGVGISYLF